MRCGCGCVLAPAARRRANGGRSRCPTFSRTRCWRTGRRWPANLGFRSLVALPLRRRGRAAGHGDLLFRRRRRAERGVAQSAAHGGRPDGGDGAEGAADRRPAAGQFGAQRLERGAGVTVRGVARSSAAAGRISGRSLHRSARAAGRVGRLHFEDSGGECRGAASDAEGRALVEVKASGEVLLDRIADLQKLSEAERGEVEPAVSVFDVRDPMREALTIATGRRDAVALQHLEPDDVATMASDRRRVVRLLARLIANAYAFTGSGTGAHGGGGARGPGGVSRGGHGDRHSARGAADGVRGIPARRAAGEGERAGACARAWGSRWRGGRRGCWAATSCWSARRERARRFAWSCRWCTRGPPSGRRGRRARRLREPDSIRTDSHDAVHDDDAGILHAAGRRRGVSARHPLLLRAPDAVRGVPRPARPGVGEASAGRAARRSSSAAAPVAGGSRVTGSSYLFAMQVARFFATLPPMDAPAEDA